MINLIYTSTASHEMSEQELLDLLEQARNRNEISNVTGMLLYGRGCFFQILEGEEKNVNEIYQSIEQDKRNYGNIIIQKREITERSFKNWSMGFRDLRKESKDSVDGYTEFMNSTDQDLGDNPSLVIKLLNQFKNNN